MIVQIDPEQPEGWLVARVVQTLKRGGVAVIPTDTVYGLVCGISHAGAIRRIYALKQMASKKPLSILVDDMQTVGRYTRGVSTPVFRMMKRVLPGPYTFIFRASDDVPKIMLHQRKTIGIRMPDHAIVLAVLAEVGEPLLSTSIRNPHDDFVNDPNEIEERLGARLDVVVDGGVLKPVPSTVVDFSEDPPVLVREGKGDVAALELF